MSYKRYKIGDRIFYEDYNKEICTDIVIDIKEKTYEEANGKLFHYQWLVTWKSESGCSMGVENYICISPNNPKVRELAEKYAKFDANKEQIISDMLKVLEPYDDQIKLDAVKLLNVKLGGDAI